MSDTSGWGSPEQPGPGRDEASQPPPPPPPPPGWSPQQPPASPPGGGWGAPGDWAGPSGPSGAGAPPGGGPPPPGWGAGGPAPGWGAGGPAPGWGHRPAAAKPGIIPLRPLALGEILDGAITCIRTHPGIMVGLSAVVVTISQLIQLPILYLLLRDLSAAESLGPDADPGAVFEVFAGSLSALLVSAVITWLAQLVLTGMLTVVVSRAVLGRRIGAGEAWAAVRPRLAALVGLTLLTFLLVLAAVLVGLLPGLLAAGAGAPGALVAILLVLGGLAAVVAAIYVYVTLALAPAALVLEKQGVVPSIRRSRRLVHGGWWRVFGVLVLAAIISAVISQIVQLPFGLLGGGLLGFDPEAAARLPALLASAVGAILAGAITSPFNAGVLVLLYVDQRMRREALDLELARAAGVAGAPGPTPPAYPPGLYPPGSGR